MYTYAHTHFTWKKKLTDVTINVWRLSHAQCVYIYIGLTNWVLYSSWDETLCAFATSYSPPSSYLPDLNTDDLCHLAIYLSPPFTWYSQSIFSMSRYHALKTCLWEQRVGSLTETNPSCLWSWPQHGALLSRGLFCPWWSEHTLFKIIIDTHINEFLEKKQERLGHSSTPSFSPSWTTELQSGFAQITYIGLIEVIVCVHARIVYGHTHTRSSYALLSRDGKIPLEIMASLHHFLREIILYISYWRVEGQVIFSDSQLVVGRHKTLCERNTRW